MEIFILFHTALHSRFTRYCAHIDSDFKVHAKSMKFFADKNVQNAFGRYFPHKTGCADDKVHCLRRYA